MKNTHLQTALQDLSLGGLRFYPSVSSTNDIALNWAAEDAADLSLVVADEQTAGRGRNRRRWLTLPDSALAFSLILHPSRNETKYLSRFTGLGALALTTMLRETYALPVQIKWPNDVLCAGKKISGILTETVWNGDSVQAVIVGMGVNITPQAVPPQSALSFPATSLEAALGKSLPRWTVLHDILAALLRWRPRLAADAFIQAWEQNLAWRGKQVEVHARGGEIIRGTVLALNADGSLRLRTQNGIIQNIHFGDVHLRPFAL